MAPCVTPFALRTGARLCRKRSSFTLTLTRGYEAIRMAQDIGSEVKRIIKEQLDVEEKDIKPESTFIEDLGADSLGLVELVLAFEEAFEIDIPDEDTEKIRTVQDAVDYIEKHAKK
jgi:acyl carrier protein